MRTIEINTSQNVIIEYEIAKVGQRVLAQVLDLLVVLGYSIIVIFIFMPLILGQHIIDDYQSKTLSTILLYLFISLPPIFYSLLNELLFKGQSIGKKAAGIRIVKTNGENATYKDYAMRWVFRIVDLWMSCGGLGAMFIAGTDKGQRLGDMVSGTVAIRLRPTRKYSLNEILTIRKQENHEISYPNASIFTDEDMLLIKASLNRVKKFPNEHNRKLIQQLTQKTKEKLEVEKLDTTNEIFLRTVLQDYIVITR